MEQSRSSDDRWFYRTEGQWEGLRKWQRAHVHGPVPRAHLRVMIANGELPPDVLVAPAGGLWHPADGGSRWVPPDLPPPGDGEARLNAARFATASATSLADWLRQGLDLFMADAGAFMGAGALVLLVGLVTAGIAAPPLWVGLCRMALRRLDGRRIAARDVFDGFLYFWRSWAYGLLVVVAVPSTVLWIPTLWSLAHGTREAGLAPLLAISVAVAHLHMAFGALVLTLTLFTVPMISEGAGALEAIRSSAAKTFPRLWTFFVVCVAFEFIAWVGQSMYFVGIVVTMPIIACATAVVYRSVFAPGAAVLRPLADTGEARKAEGT